MMRAAAGVLACVLAALLLAALIFVLAPAPVPARPRPEPSSLLACELTADCGANAWQH